MKWSYVILGVIILLIVGAVFVFVNQQDNKEIKTINPSQEENFKPISQLSVCEDWINYKDMGYLGCFPENSNTKFTIKNNLDKGIRINMDYLAGGIKLDSIESKQQKTIALGNQNEEVMIKVSDWEYNTLSPSEINQILFKIK